MKTKLIVGTMAAAGAALLAAGAMAADSGKSRGWDRMDVNGDGKLTAEEMAEKHEAFIAAADADGDGAVTQEEMKAYRKARRDERREKRNPDKNDDGVVDRTEFLNAAQERFDRMDKNGDGVLSEDETRRRKGHGRRHRGGDQD